MVQMTSERILLITMIGLLGLGNVIQFISRNNYKIACENYKVAITKYEKAISTYEKIIRY